MDDQQTLYDIFDLEHNATGAQILARYRLLRDQLTADGVAYDDPQFVTLNDAYRILSDNTKRAEYDEQLKADGLYHAVERVDERTSLADLFELDDDELFEPETIPEQESSYPLIQPLLIKFDPNRAERIREFKVKQQQALAQSKQQSLQVLDKRQLRKRRLILGCFGFTLFVLLGSMGIGIFGNLVIDNSPDQAEQHIESGAYSFAIHMLTSELRQQQSFDLYYLRGRSYRLRNSSTADLRDALRDFQYALKIDPHANIVYRERGLTFYLICQSDRLNYCNLAMDDLAFYVSTINSRDDEVFDALAYLTEQQDDE